MGLASGGQSRGAGCVGLAYRGQSRGARGVRIGAGWGVDRYVIGSTSVKDRGWGRKRHRWVLSEVSTAYLAVHVDLRG